MDFRNGSGSGEFPRELFGLSCVISLLEEENHFHSQVKENNLGVPVGRDIGLRDVLLTLYGRLPAEALPYFHPAGNHYHLGICRRAHPRHTRRTPQ